MSHVERVELIESIFTHILATALVVGFMGLSYMTLLGFVDIKNPTISGFVGTLLGAVGAKIEPPIVRYFGQRRIEGEVKRAVCEKCGQKPG